MERKRRVKKVEPVTVVTEEIVQEPVVVEQPLEEVPEPEPEPEIKDTKTKWRKVGRGCLVIRGQMIRPNQVFLAEATDIPESFKDLIVPVPDSIIITRKPPLPELIIQRPVINRPPPKGEIPRAEDSKDPAMQPKSSQYELKIHPGSPELWDIVDKQGKVLSENPLSYVDATNLIEAL